MSKDKFNDSIASLLSEGRINHVINVLRRKCAEGVASHPDLAALDARLAAVADTYHRMRQFLIGGFPDPERERVLSGVKRELRELGRQYLFVCNENRLDPLFAEYRLQKVRHSDMTAIAEKYRKNLYRLEMARETESDTEAFLRSGEELVEAAFRRAWAMPPAAADEREAVAALLRDPDVEFALKSQLISGLLLGALRFNDPGKLELLLAAYEEADDERLEARALTAVVLILARWGNSAVASPAIEGRLSSISDSILTYTRLKDVVMTLIRTRDTDRVSREVTEAFNTTMKELTPEMLEKLQRDGMLADGAEGDINPEWERLMKNKDIEEKMKALNDMQLEGMDVMMQTFSRLKAFPFFRSMANWFLPFSAAHSAVSPLFENFSGEAFASMADATEMCSADRFSFALGILQMPADRREMLGGHLNGQLEAMRDLLKDRENVGRKPLFAAEALSFARDLYRFAKVYPKHTEYPDPFSEPLDFLHLPYLGALLADDEIIETAADFYFNHGYHSLAASLYEEAAGRGVAERELYEKLGYSYQMLGDFRRALESYERADLFSSDADRSSTWLLRKLAFANRALGNFSAAADYYRRLLERTPDDLSLEFRLAGLLLQSGDLKGAGERAAKLCYLNPDHAGYRKLSGRIKAHEAFIDGNYGEAAGLYAIDRIGLTDEQETAWRRELAAELRRIDPKADVDLLLLMLDSDVGNPE